MWTTLAPRPHAHRRTKTEEADNSRATKTGQLHSLSTALNNWGDRRNKRRLAFERGLSTGSFPTGDNESLHFRAESGLGLSSGA
jgi:hypothetical protein